MSHITRFSIVHTIRNTFEVSWGTKVSVTWHFNGRLYTDEVGWELGPYVEGVRRWTYRTGETSLLSLFLLPIEVFLSFSYRSPSINLTWLRWPLQSPWVNIEDPIIFSVKDILVGVSNGWSFNFFAQI